MSTLGDLLAFVARRDLEIELRVSVMALPLACGAATEKQT